MFENIGSKLKSVATVTTFIGILCSCIIGLVLLIMGNGVGLVIAIVGSLLSWIGSLTMYGLGQLVENTDIIAGNTKKQYTATRDMAKQTNNNLDKKTENEQQKDDAKNGKDVDRSHIDYSCRTIKCSGDYTKGMCLICHSVHDDLEYCSIKTDKETNELFICQQCKELYKDNSLE